MVTEQSAIPEPRLIDVVVALESRGEQEDADYYRLIYAPFLSVIYEIDENELLYMTINEISQLPELPLKPLKYEGWNTFFFGRAAFDNKH